MYRAINVLKRWIKGRGKFFILCRLGTYTKCSNKLHYFFTTKRIESNYIESTLSILGKAVVKIGTKVIKFTVPKKPKKGNKKPNTKGTKPGKKGKKPKKKTVSKYCYLKFLDISFTKNLIMHIWVLNNSDRACIIIRKMNNRYCFIIFNCIISQYLSFFFLAKGHITIGKVTYTYAIYGDARKNFSCFTGT